MEVKKCGGHHSLGWCVGWEEERVSQRPAFTALCFLTTETVGRLPQAPAAGVKLLKGASSQLFSYKKSNQHTNLNETDIIKMISLHFFLAPPPFFFKENCVWAFCLPICPGSAIEAGAGVTDGWL